MFALLSMWIRLCQESPQLPGMTQSDSTVYNDMMVAKGLILLFLDYYGTEFNSGLRGLPDPVSLP